MKGLKNMLREYELTLIAKGDLPETEVSKLCAKYEGILTQDGGQIIKKDNWGNKRLTYPIKKSYRGYYVNYDVASNPAAIAEVERLFRIDENVLRYLTIKLAEKVDVEERKRELAKAQAQESAARNQNQDDLMN